MDEVEALLGAELDPLAFAPPPAEALAPSPRARRDRVRGMLFGVALGDALGAPHEFRDQVPLAQYTGALEHTLTVCRRFQGGRLFGAVGQVTDDTEMMIALAGALARSGGYDGEKAVAGYLAWANSRCPFVGNNTRALFVGVTTHAGYRRRWQRLGQRPQAEWSQANGCLMRCAPLAALPSSAWEAAAAQDCAATNPHPVCVDAVRAYLAAARALLAGASPAAATAAASAAATEAGVIAAIATGRDQEDRDVTAQKGWVLHALYCAFLALNDPSAAAFQDRIDRVVRLAGDTDTNAAIAGALLGAQLGETALRAEERTGQNLDTVLRCDPTASGLPRPEKYAAARLPALADALAALSA